MSVAATIEGSGNVCVVTSATPGLKRATNLAFIDFAAAPDTCIKDSVDNFVLDKLLIKRAVRQGAYLLRNNAASQAHEWINDFGKPFRRKNMARVLFNDWLQLWLGLDQMVECLVQDIGGRQSKFGRLQW